MSFRPVNYSISLFLALSILGCRPKEEVMGTWTYLTKIKDGMELKREGHDTLQISYTDSGEMIYLTNGNRTGIGFYYYKIAGDSIFRTNVQIDSTGKRSSFPLGSNKFSIRNDTMTVETDKGRLYYKKKND